MERQVLMNWGSIDFDWNRARAFLVTAEEGSLSAAARVLKMSQPTLGRQVSALESELDVVLFERRGRGLELTQSGLELLEHVRAMGEGAASLSLTASGRSHSLEGNICITATEVLAVFILPAIIKKLREKEPGITVELIASNAESSLKRREADIAIRGFRPTQKDLIAKKLGDVEAQLYATPAYLNQLNDPQSPAEFGNARFIAFDGHERLIKLLNSRGFNLSSENFPISSENRIVQWELVKCGAGIGLMPMHIGDRESLVCRALEEFDPLVADLWLVAHQELKTNRRVRLVFDFLASELQNLNYPN